MAFYNAINNYSNFSISFTADPFDDFGFFAKGDRLAADNTAEKLLARGHFADYEAYPVMFLYRHALELHLKNVLYRVAKLFAFKDIETMYEGFHNNHDLLIADKAYNVIKKAFPKDHELHEIMTKTKRVAKEFSDIDPNSFAYRYPVKKDGSPSTPKRQTVNLEATAVEMNALLLELENINLGIGLEIANAQEIFQELKNI